MENSYDLNLILCNFIKHGERRPPNNCASESSVDNGIQIRIANDSRQCVVDPFHELDVQILALVGIPLTSLGEFGIRVVSEPNDRVRLASNRALPKTDLLSGFLVCAHALILIGARAGPIYFRLLCFLGQHQMIAHGIPG